MDTLTIHQLHSRTQENLHLWVLWEGTSALYRGLLNQSVGHSEILSRGSLKHEDSKLESILGNLRRSCLKIKRAKCNLSAKALGSVPGTGKKVWPGTYTLTKAWIPMHNELNIESESKHLETVSKFDIGKIKPNITARFGVHSYNPSYSTIEQMVNDSDSQSLLSIQQQRKNVIGLRERQGQMT